ncbi:MAG: hypothetical protein KAQ92_06295, partial [Candidatus Aenigmarchaeota archaeon]|nr:hypothetical protein [Candidatus Aenigmarchaeota archaeon]
MDEEERNKRIYSLRSDIEKRINVVEKEISELPEGNVKEEFLEEMNEDFGELRGIEKIKDVRENASISLPKHPR